MRKTKLLVAAIIILCCMLQQTRVFASDGERYITISVDATDDSGDLKYAIDTDDPSAFTDSNEFTVLAGTDHTIYVRDAAGNITSQKYTSDQSNGEEVSSVAESSESSEGNEQQINIELDIGRTQYSSETDYSNYEYLTDEPVEPGTGTVAEKIKTDSSDDAERIFYTFTTKEGNVLYLVIDQGQSADNVYLLDTVSTSDLLALADSSGGNQVEKEEDNLLAALSKESATDDEIAENVKGDSNSSNSNLVIVFIIVAIGGGIYYYFKIYKNKKEESMDSIDEAMDMEDFEPEEEDDEEIDFDDDEKEKFLEDLISGDDENLYNADPNEYAASELETEIDISGFDNDFAPEDDEEMMITEALSMEEEEFEEDV